MPNKKLKNLVILLALAAFILSTGFTPKRLTPHTVYRVYLKGESLGLIKSKEQLENYIDKKQAEIKAKYNVDKVYIPSDLDIIKEITYDDNLTSVEKIYSEIKDISPFTIKGYSITIHGVETQDVTGKTVKSENNVIYVLDKNIFREAVDKVAKSFILEEDYNAYANDTQAKIDDTGKIIENIYLQNTITIKQKKIPVNKTIYQNEEDLSKYLIFGTVDEQQKYVVQDGDTLEDIAFNNKVSTNELLIANPSIGDANSLLYPGQVITIGVLKPQFNIVEVDHVVFYETKNFTTDTQYDNNQYEGYTEIRQKGVNGENKVTQKVQKVNGETTNLVTVNTETIKEPITEIIVKGGKKNVHGYGSVVPTRGEWGWPATCSSVSSGFGYRWGALHDGVDIAGCGYGSNIFAAQSGVVVASQRKNGGYKGGYGDNGEYIIIDHKNGYYTIYAHLCPGCRYVSVGDTVVKGQVIGGMGMTGAATGVHLHFGLWYGYPYRGGRAQNALSYY